MVHSSFRSRFFHPGFLASLFVFSCLSLVQAVDVIWQGTNNAWGTTSNWSTNALPTAADRAVFGSSAVGTSIAVSNGGDKTVGGILFNGNANYTITVSSGVVYVGNQGIEVTSGTQTFQSGNVRLNVGGDTTILNNGTLNFNSGLMYHRTVGTGNKVLTFDGTGNTTVANLQRRNNTYDMSIVKTGTGTLTITAVSGAATSTAAGSITGTTTINGGKIRINNEGSLGGDAASFNAAQLTLNGGTLGIFGTTTIDDANRGITLGSSGGTFEVEGTNTLTVANVVTGTGGLTKTGPGTLILSGVNTYTGLTTVSTGILNVQNNNALGTADAGSVVANGATLQVQGNIDLGAEALTISGTGLAGQAGVLVNLSGTNTISGALTLGANSTIASVSGELNLTSAAAVVGNNSTLTLTGAGNGSLGGAMDATVASVIKSGTGNWALNGTNTYTGATTIRAGTLTVGSTGSLGNTAVTVENTATFNVLGATGTGAVTVQAGGTLAGSGTVGGAVTLSNGATLTAGNSLVVGSTGVLSIAGGLTLNNDTALNFNLGTDSDRINVTGNLLLNGVLRITPGAGFGSASSYALLTYTGTLTDANLVLGGLTAGYNYSISTIFAPGQVTLQMNQFGLQFWDGVNTSGNNAINGGPGIWTNTAGNTNWTDGTGSTNAGWVPGQTAVFVGTPGDVQLADTIAVAGLQFGSSYHLVDAGGNVGKLNISAAETEMRVDPSVTATIGVAIMGTGGISKTGNGTLALSALSSYTGATVVREGTLQIGVTNALPSGTALTVGSEGLAAHLDSSMASLTVGSLQVASNTSATSTITIGAGQILTVTGPGGFKVGVAGTYKARTNATFTGGGSLVINNASANFEAGIQSNTSTTVGPGGDSQFDSTSNTNTSVVDMTGLSSFAATVNFFRVGHGLNNNSTLSLSNTANTITANVVQIADSAGLNPGLGSSNLILGTGTNIIQADAINIGISKGTGVLKFQSQTAGSAGTVQIGGKTGLTTNITVGSTATNTGYTPSGTLDLRGHIATIAANNLFIAKRDVAGSGGATGVVYFDGGQFTANNVEIGSINSNSTGTANGTLTISGGTFTVNSGGSFKLATFANTNTSGKAQATLTITGGTLVSNVDIQEVGGTNSNTTNTVTTITLNGGTLDMTGHNIGSATNTINTFTLASGTLKDTGEINGGAPITKTTIGTLVMQGNNAYTGATTVSAGTMLVNNSYAGSSSATGSALVTVNSGTTFGGNGRVAGPVTLNTGATLAPGGNATTIANGAVGLNTDVGTLKIDNALTVSSGANLALQLKTNGTHGLNATYDPTTGMLTSVSGTSTDGGNDRILVTGALTLDSSAKLTVTFGSGYAPTSGTVFDLLDWGTVNGGSSILSGFYDFAGTGRRTGADNLAYGLILPDLTIYGSEYFWDVSQFGATGAISIVPEPGRALLFMAGLCTLLLRRRRC